MDSKQSSFIMVPSQVWEGILNDLKEIKTYVKESKENEGFGDFITEEQAKKLLGRKTTWFWSMRKDGKLKYNKIGNRVYYSRLQIIGLLE